ncbi:MAG TPA: phosphatidate cytidylyltransferase [Vicinamibacterales bacterium]|jgi:phosphatidate cytidylyltransferase|nr:phosphatidate cytidylyltransferase [Vicinamibacterales bacterium]
MTRLVSGVVLALVAVAAIVWLPLVALRVLAAAVAAAAGLEYAGAAGVSRDLSRALIVVMAAITCWWFGMPAFASVAVVTAVVLAWLAVEVLLFGHDITRAAVAVVGAAYVGGPLGLLVAIHARTGWKVTLLLIATVVVSDTAQYYSGRAFGRRPLAPVVSPKKTIEGAIGGLVAAALFMAIAGGRILVGEAPVPLAVLGLSMAAVGICGDLFESSLKRRAGLKDSSSLIPGHGGVLDRIDALLFATPLFYLFLRDLP